MDTAFIEVVLKPIEESVDWILYPVQAGHFPDTVAKLVNLPKI